MIRKPSCNENIYKTNFEFSKKPKNIKWFEEQFDCCEFLNLFKACFVDKVLNCNNGLFHF